MFFRRRHPEQRTLLKRRTVCGNQKTYFLWRQSAFIPPQLFTNWWKTSVCSESSKAWPCSFRFSNSVRSGINVLPFGKDRSGTLFTFAYSRGIYHAERDRRSCRNLSGVIGWASDLVTSMYIQITFYKNILSGIFNLAHKEEKSERFLHKRVPCY